VNKEAIRGEVIVVSISRLQKKWAREILNEWMRSSGIGLTNYMSYNLHVMWDEYVSTN